jgi:PKD repeat protein
MLCEMSFMKPITHCFLRTGAALCVVCGFATLASAQNLTLRIACYNIDADTSGTAPNPGLIYPASGSTATTNGGVLEGIGEEILSDGVAQPLDILGLEETSGNTDTVAPIVAGLKAYYSQYNPLASNMYAMAPQGYLTTGTGNGPNALVYNTKTVQLLATVPVDPPGGTSQLGSASGEYREVMRYEFAPAGQTPTAATEFYIYVSHYKAGTSSTDMKDRAEEAAIIRNNETNLPANARVLYVGDYNVDTSGEAGYQTIIAANSPGGVAQGKGVDPLNVSGSTTIDWEDTTTNKSILVMLTEEDYELRYRDDLQIGTTNVYSDAAGGLALVANTYHAFGNNGSLPYGSTVTASGNTALTNIPPGSPLSASTLYADLIGASDHLPVVADYTIPVVQPGAVFTAAPTSALPPLTVTFTDGSTGIVTNWYWTFGDGAASNTTTTTSVVHTYTSAGVYTVAETVTGPGGANTSTQTSLITVLTPFQAWQLQYFGCTACPQAQPGVDSDGTGQNNLFKYVAGLNPTNTNSIFVFSIASVPNQPGWMNLIFSPVVAGRTYTPQVTTNLLNIPWAPLTTTAAPPVTNGVQVTLTDTNASRQQEFYQMEISLP